MFWLSNYNDGPKIFWDNLGISSLALSANIYFGLEYDFGHKDKGIET